MAEVRRSVSAAVFFLCWNREQDRNAVDAVATERKRNWQGVRPECGAGEQSGKKSKQKQLFAGTAWHTQHPPRLLCPPSFARFFGGNRNPDKPGPWA